MKRYLFLIIAGIMLMEASIQAAPPQFVSGTFTRSTPLVVGQRSEGEWGYSAPQVIDWDHDDKKDLIIGDVTGYIWFYKNQGTNDNPIFTTGVKLRDSQGDIGVFSSAVPFVANWDNENDWDLVIGDGLGKITLYRSLNKWSPNSAPIFGTGSKILAAGEELGVGFQAAPFVGYWNDDYVKDLIVGNIQGEVLIFLGNGADSNPTFGNPVALQFGTGTRLSLNNPAVPFVTSWDSGGGGGTKDLLLGDTEGYVRLYLNIPTTGTASFVADPKNYRLIKANQVVLDVGYLAKPVVVDWNSDNKKDLIIGEMYGQINLCLNVGSDFDPVFDTPFQVHINGPKVLDAGKNAAPFVCDWNNDHINDLMIGDDQGELRVYSGVKDNISLQFAASSQIQLVSAPAKGTPTFSPLDVGENAGPVVLDYNGDQKKDLLVGSSDGQLYLFLNSGTDQTPIFGSQTKMVIGQDSDFGDDSRPYMVDWNKDGLKDLLVGNKIGQVYVCLNSGSNPVFPEKRSVLTIIGGYACPSLIYGDGDEKRDLIVGSGDGHIYFYKNVGTDEDPRFDSLWPSKIIADSKLLKIDGRAIPYVGDWNGDGINDLIVGIGNDSGDAPAGQIKLFLGLTTNTPPKVNVRTPSGTQTGKITIEYTLIDEESNTCNIRVRYSQNEGLTWATATLSLQAGDLAINLSSSPDGTKHTLVWNSASDIPATISQVWVQVIPDDGKADGNSGIATDNTAKFVVDNINLLSDRMIKLVGVEKILDVGAYSKPHIANWDEKNGPDLLIGDEFGNVYVAYNAAPPDTTPSFFHILKLQHRIGTGSATQEVDVGYQASPFVMDWDGDGDNDLLVGNSDGELFLFRNIRNISGLAPPELGPKEKINLPMTSGQAAIFGIEGNWSQGTPTKNLLVGDSEGMVSLFLNKSTPETPAFTTGVKLSTNPPIDVGDNAVPYWADWNGNGKKDLIVGSQDGFVYLFVNYGTSTPLFFNASKIAVEDKPIQARLGFSAPVVYDWDSDGQKDILVGTKEGHILFFAGGSRTNHPPEVGITAIVGTQTGLITFSYLVRDEDGNEVEVTPEFFVVAPLAEVAPEGGQWRPATLTYSSGTNTTTGLIANADGRQYTFIWNSRQDLPATETQVLFRIVPQDRIKGMKDKVGTSNIVIFPLDNYNVLPQISINVSGSSTDIVVTYNLVEPDDAWGTLTVEYQGGRVGTGTWATPTLTSNITRVKPGPGTFTWLSSVDEDGTSGANYQIRITPYDQIGTGSMAITPPFFIDNTRIFSSIISGTATLPIQLTLSTAKVEIKEFYSKVSPREDAIVSVRKVASSEVVPMKTLTGLDNTIHEFKVTKRSNPGQEVKISKALITIPYDDLGSFKTESQLRIFKLEQGKWVLAEGTGGSPDMNKNEVSVEVSGFSIYRIGLEVPTLSNFQVWPNPFKPNDGIKGNGEFGVGGDYEFIIFSGVSKVKIYTMSAELVRESNESELDETGTWKWDAKNYDSRLVATGVYIYLVTDKNGRSKTGRIAVIR